MTKEEAIEKILLNVKDTCALSCNKKLCNECGFEEANIIAVGCIRKQIPARPMRRLNDYICKECYRIVYRADNFCSRCG